jgi:hypothetical protein
VLRRPLERACQLAGVGKRLTTHGLRRTFNNLSRQLNGEIVTRSMTGHVTAAMTEHYSHVGRDENLAAVTRIEEVVSLSGDRSGDQVGDRPKRKTPARRRRFPTEPNLSCGRGESNSHSITATRT